MVLKVDTAVTWDKAVHRLKKGKVVMVSGAAMIAAYGGAGNLDSIPSGASADALMDHEATSN
jgi:hypothetical protein